jgi:hypothetical protein
MNQIETTKVTAEQVKVKAEAILSEMNVQNVFVYVRERMKKAHTWCRRADIPSGVFDVEFSGLQSHVNWKRRQPRDNFFRTDKNGELPVEKIKQFIAKRVAEISAKQNTEKQNTEILIGNKDLHARVVKMAKDITGCLYSDFQSSYEYVANLPIEGKLRVNIGPQVLTEEQAKALFELVASFRKK